MSEPSKAARQAWTSIVFAMQTNNEAWVGPLEIQRAIDNATAELEKDRERLIGEAAVLRDYRARHEAIDATQEEKPGEDYED